MSIAVLFGGASWEHEISIVSAITLKKVLGKRISSFIFLDEKHNFYAIPSASMHVQFFAEGGYLKCTKLTLGHGGFSHRSLFKTTTLQFDFILNLVHGADGEDGSLACLLDFYGVSFIGPRSEACTLSFNKHYTKLFASARGVKMLPFERLSCTEDREALKTKLSHAPFFKCLAKDNAESTLNFPLIVKPSRLGSSIGVNVANDAKSLDYALDSAFEYDNEVILEPFIKGVKEYNLAGFKAKDFVFSIIEEPQKQDLLDFENKYLDFSRDGKSAKAELDPRLEKEMQEIFKKIYENCFEGALIRCDFFVVDGKVYLNEINPIPGSMANYLFENFGSAIDELKDFLPHKKPIIIDYQYIKKIQKAK